MTGEPEKHSGLNYSVISLAKVTQISFPSRNDLEDIYHSNFNEMATG